MTLIPVEYPLRLRSPAEARALYSRLGDDRVGVRGFRTADPGRIDRLVAAIDPARETAVNFENGTLDDGGWSRLDGVAAGQPHYLDVYAGTANLRAWPDHTKVYSRLPDGGVDAVARALGEPLRAGANQLGETSVVIDPVAGYPLAVAITTTDRAVALRMFRALGQHQVSRGCVMRATEPTKIALAPFVRGLGATLHVVLDVAVDVAVELSTTCSELKHDWQTNTVLVEFPEGRIHGFLRTPNTTERDREQWLARIATALGQR